MQVRMFIRKYRVALYILGFALVAVGLTGTSIFRNTTGTISPGSGLYLVALFSPLLLILAATIAAIMIRAANESRLTRFQGIQFEDITSQDIPMPEYGLKFEQEIQSLDFRPLGKLAPREPDQGDADTAWVYANEDGSTAAQTLAPVRFNRAFMVFTSFFPDGSVVETHFPSQTTLRASNYWSTGGYASISSAYQAHREKLALFNSTHGDAIPILTLDAYREQGRSYRQNQLPILIRSALGRLLVSPAALGLIGVGLLAINIFAAANKLPISTFVIFIAVILTLGALLIGWSFSRRLRKSM